MRKIVHVDVDRDMLEIAVMEYLVAKGKVPDTAMYFSDTSMIFIKGEGGKFLKSLIDIDFSVVCEEEDDN
jgi:hypothetical protein